MAPLGWPRLGARLWTTVLGSAATGVRPTRESQRYTPLGARGEGEWPPFLPPPSPIPPSPPSVPSLLGFSSGGCGRGACGSAPSLVAWACTSGSVLGALGLGPDREGWRRGARSGRPAWRFLPPASLWASSLLLWSGTLLAVAAWKVASPAGEGDPGMRGGTRRPWSHTLYVLSGSRPERGAGPQPFRREDPPGTLTHPRGLTRATRRGPGTHQTTYSMGRERIVILYRLQGPKPLSAPPPRPDIIGSGAKPNQKSLNGEGQRNEFPATFFLSRGKWVVQRLPLSSS